MAPYTLTKPVMLALLADSVQRHVLSSPCQGIPKGYVIRLLVPSLVPIISIEYPHSLYVKW